MNINSTYFKRLTEKIGVRRFYRRSAIYEAMHGGRKWQRATKLSDIKARARQDDSTTR